MVRQRVRRIDARGFSLAELLATTAMIGITAAVALPFFLTYWQASTLRAGAQELATVMNQARQLAITQNTTVCVSRSGTRVRFLTGGCGGTVWTGPGTDGSGWIALQNSVEVSGSTQNVVFGNLGAANPGGTYTVRNPVDGRTLSVVVAVSGRVSIGP